MEKATLNQLFKDGEKFQFKKVDYASSDVKKDIERLKLKQQETLESMKVDINNLRKITFDI